jgi:hypothetical protein
VFKKIDAKEFKKGKESSLQIQYDYMEAYFDFFIGHESNFTRARKITKEYEEYPILHWRLLFLDMQDQLREYDGEDIDAELKEELAELREKDKKKVAKEEPKLIFNLEKDMLIIEHKNVRHIVIKYYIVDLEFLFSRTPFLMSVSILT